MLESIALLISSIAPRSPGGPVYVRHEVVHNRHVVDDLRTRGAVFVDELSEVPDDAVVIFRLMGYPVQCRMRRKAAATGPRRNVLWLPKCMS